MRILHAVEFYHPSVGGAQAVVRQISERLAARGHDVTVATSHLPGRGDGRLGGVRIAPFRVAGNLVRGMQGEVERYRRFVREGGFDVVMVYAAQQWTCDALLPDLADIPAKKVFVPCGFSGLHRSEYHEYFRRMPEVLARFDALVFLSKRYRDVAFAREHGLEKRVLIPNGAAAEEFASAATDFRARFRIPAGTMILSVGSHTRLKGHLEAIEGFRRAGIRDATLVVLANRGLRGCGMDCAMRSSFLNVSARARRERKRVRIWTVDRGDTIAAYQAADLFLFPSRVECSPLVLFEAMAAGCPFAASSAGNTEEIIEWSGGGVLIPGREEPDGLTSTTPEAVAGTIERLLSDPALRERLGTQGRAAWRARFTFEAIASQYEELYARLLDGRPVTFDA